MNDFFLFVSLSVRSSYRCPHGPCHIVVYPHNFVNIIEDTLLLRCLSLYLAMKILALRELSVRSFVFRKPSDLTVNLLPLNVVEPQPPLPGFGMISPSPLDPEVTPSSALTIWLGQQPKPCGPCPANPTSAEGFKRSYAPSLAACTLPSISKTRLAIRTNRDFVFRPLNPQTTKTTPIEISAPIYTGDTRHSQNTVGKGVPFQNGNKAHNMSIPGLGQIIPPQVWHGPFCPQSKPRIDIPPGNNRHNKHRHPPHQPRARLRMALLRPMARQRRPRIGPQSPPG